MSGEEQKLPRRRPNCLSACRMTRFRAKNGRWTCRSGGSPLHTTFLAVGTYPPSTAHKSASFLFSNQLPKPSKALLVFHLTCKDPSCGQQHNRASALSAQLPFLDPAQQRQTVKHSIESPEHGLSRGTISVRWTTVELRLDHASHFDKFAVEAFFFPPKHSEPARSGPNSRTIPARLSYLVGKSVRSFSKFFEPN